MTAAPPVLTLDLLRTLLGVEDHHSPRNLIRRAAAVNAALPQLVLSAAAHEGTRLGTGSRDLLRRAAERAQCYAELHELIADAVPVRVLKGPSLARRYPAGLMRPVGDLDVTVADEEQLWQVVAVVAANAPVESVNLTLTRHGDRTDVIVGLLWPSEDEFFDRPRTVEVTTVPFHGDLGGTVPSRYAVPGDPWTADALALAEERFQRPFGAKDYADVLVLLADESAPAPADLAAAAADLSLAPELLALLNETRDSAGDVPSGPLALAYADALRVPAGDEEARRAAAGPSSPAEPPDGAEARLACGLPVHGMPLGPPRLRSVPPRALRHDEEGVSLLRTRIGDYLLVDGEIVSRDSYDTALKVLDRLEELR